ncbi:hypothetical protein Tco_1039661 [Tanacetum coccineum]
MLTSCEVDIVVFVISIIPGLQVVNTAARCTFFLLTGLVSAGRTMILLVVILSARRLVSAAMDYAADSRVTCGGHTFCWWDHLAEGVDYAANTSIHAAVLVCAGSIMFLLADLFRCNTKYLFLLLDLVSADLHL